MTFEVNRSHAEVSPDIAQPLLILPWQFFNRPDMGQMSAGGMEAAEGPLAPGPSREIAVW